MATQNGERICFVISPIGEEGSEIRRHSDQVLTHIITPAAKECGYDNPIRADKISEPGIITSQVIQHLLDDTLVIADLTGRNANVFYELAVRHAVRKPIVQVIEFGESIPFDVAQSRTIQFDLHDLDSVARCKDELVKQIQSVESNPEDVDSPISVAIDLQRLRQSGNPLEQSNAEIISMLQDIRLRVGELTPWRSLMTYGRAGDIRSLFRELAGILRLPEDQEPTREQSEEALVFLRRLFRLIEPLLHDAQTEMSQRGSQLRFTAEPVDGST